MRKFTLREAADAYAILVKEAGASNDPDSWLSFVRTFGDPLNKSAEFRFGGCLGFGGKFRPGPRDGVPSVDCYREDVTPERTDCVERTNGALASAFAGPDAEPRRRLRSGIDR